MRLVNPSLTCICDNLVLMMRATRMRTSMREKLGYEVGQCDSDTGDGWERYYPTLAPCPRSACYTILHLSFLIVTHIIWIMSLIVTLIKKRLDFTKALEIQIMPDNLKRSIVIVAKRSSLPDCAN